MKQLRLIPPTHICVREFYEVKMSILPLSPLAFSLQWANSFDNEFVITMGHTTLSSSAPADVRRPKISLQSKYVM